MQLPTYVDIYHLHGVKPQQYDQVVPALLPTLEKMRDQGKIRFIGVTESFTLDLNHQMLIRALDDHHWDVIMAGFNCINQTAKAALLPKAIARGTEVLGMFAVRNALRNPENLAATMKALQAEGLITANVSPASVLALLDYSNIVSVPDLAYRYCRHQPGIDVIMFGTGNLEHLHQNIASLLRSPLPDIVTDYLDQAFSSVVSFTGN